MATTNNDGKSVISSNTYGYTSRNYASMTALAVNYFNKMASLGIHLPQEGKKGDFPSFDYTSGVTAYLQPKDCKLLAKRGKKAIKLMEETGSFEAFAIPLKRGLVEVTQVSELRSKLKSISGDANPSDIAIVIYTDVDDSKKTDKYLVHVFNEDVVIKGYDPTSGKYSSERENVEFEYFLDALVQFADAMTNGMVHALKDDGKFARQKWEKVAYELAANLGVDLAKPGSKGGKPSTSWNDNSSGGADRYAGGKDSGRYNAEMVDASEEDVDSIISQITGS
jgi:hypothetical protein